MQPRRIGRYDVLGKLGSGVVAVQFSSAQDGYLLWSGKFDRVLDDVLSVQPDIAGRVVTALGTQLRGDDAP